VVNEVLIKASNNQCKLLHLARDLDTSFKVMNVMPAFSEAVGGTVMLEFYLDKKRMQHVEEFLRTRDRYSELSIEQRSRDLYVVVLRTNKACGCEALTKSGCFLSGCEFSPRGMFINLLAGTNEALHAFITTMESYGFDITVLKKRSALSVSSDLSERQMEVIQAAFNKGYYDVPRRISLKALATAMGVSPSNVEEVLKRAEKKILAHYFMQ